MPPTQSLLGVAERCRQRSHGECRRSPDRRSLSHDSAGGLADRASTAELVCFDPPKQWGVRGLDGPIRAIVEVTVEPISDARAHLTIALAFEGHGIGRLLVPLLVRREARREMPLNVMTLKRRLEASA